MIKRFRVMAQSRYPGLFSIYTHLTERERLLLFELAKSLEPGATVVEIGSYLGASTCFLAAGVRLRGGKVYAVDTWTNIAMSEGPRDTYQDFLQNTAPLRRWIVPLRGLSKEVAQRFNGKIDLMFVDGDHSYEAVRADLEMWLPKVKDGGVVVFHDYNWAEGVQRAVRELVVPLQIEGGHRLDSIYWTRISHREIHNRQSGVKASVIIPTYGRPEYLKEAVVSLLSQDFSTDKYELIVIDNKPTGEVHQIIQVIEEEHKQKVRYIEEPNVGLHNARHTGAREAHGEILVYIDDDVIVPSGWLAAIIEPFRDSQVGCVGGKVVPRWEAEPPQWLSQFGSGYLSLLNLGSEQLELHYPQGVYGCNMAVRKAVLYEVGGFNPDAIGNKQLIWLRGDGETGLQKKIYEAGYKVIYEPKAWVYHRIPASRLTPHYFKWRAFIQGISDSYSRVRELNKSKSFFFRLLTESASSLLRSSLYYLKSLVLRNRSIRLRADSLYWYGRGGHQLRVLCNPELRSHVLKDTYLI